MWMATIYWAYGFPKWLCRLERTPGGTSICLSCEVSNIWQASSVPSSHSPKRPRRERSPAILGSRSPSATRANRTTWIACNGLRAIWWASGLCSPPMSRLLCGEPARCGMPSSPATRVEAFSVVNGVPASVFSRGAAVHSLFWTALPLQGGESVVHLAVWLHCEERTEAAHVTQFLERVHSLDDGLGPLGAEDGRHQITNFRVYRVGIQGVLLRPRRVAGKVAEGASIPKGHLYEAAARRRRIHQLAIGHQLDALLDGTHLRIGHAFIGVAV